MAWHLRSLVPATDVRKGGLLATLDTAIGSLLLLLKETRHRAVESVVSVGELSRADPSGLWPEFTQVEACACPAIRFLPLLLVSHFPTAVIKASGRWLTLRQ